MADANANIPADANQANEADKAHKEAKEVQEVIVDWDAVLQLCGVTTQPAHQAIVGQGYVDMTNFIALSKSGVVELVKALTKNPLQIVKIPFTVIKKLQAMRNWAKERERCGLDINEEDFNMNELTRMLAHMDFKAQLKVNPQDSLPLPSKFTSFDSQWRVFSEGLTGHLKVVHGCMNIPLVYMLHEHTDTMPEMLGATYKDSDEWLMACVKLQGNKFKQDNA
jgi:hypothetical protein